MRASTNRLLQIAAAWQPYAPTLLNTDDARDIATNLTALAKLLLEIDETAKSAEESAKEKEPD
jgi:hypothetical protein